MAQTISASAEETFQVFGANREQFYRGGKVQEIIKRDGDERLDIVKPERFCSLLEHHFYTHKWRDGKDGPELKDMPCTKNDAELLLATDAAMVFLPEIAILSACPILAPDGHIVQRGYDPETKCYVLSDLDVKVPLLEVAVKQLKGLLRDFNFHSAGDRSRAIAALLTPALTFGGFMKRTPLTFMEADASQTGKGYYVRAVATIYGEQARLVVQRNGGVGSFDESLAARLAVASSASRTTAPD